MTKDIDATHSFYEQNAQVYARRDRQAPAERLDAFLSALTPGSSILELGCGGGRDSAYMISRGFDVTSTDGSEQMAAEASLLLGRPVQVLRFEDLKAHQQFDAIWAEASLLHVHRTALPDVFERIRRALKGGGLLHATFKAGQVDGHDRFGRYYNYPSAEWLTKILDAGGWRNISLSEADGSGYDGEPTRWLFVNAIR